MPKKIKLFLLILFLQIASKPLWAQFVLSGTVFDSSKINFVQGVTVANKQGSFTITDSLGRYSLRVADKDSVSFIFKNKTTQKFAVSTISDPSHFDISLHINIKGRYSTLKEVVVFAKSYKEDSIENRATYSSVYNYHKPKWATSTSPSGVPGLDANELINAFRFKRNKRLKNFQIRLELQEQEKYISYRFNPSFVKRITHLEGEQLKMFMLKYRPTYNFVSTADEITFNQYILNCSYKYRIDLLQQDDIPHK